jgi:SAM-dependent methyltransferase
MASIRKSWFPDELVTAGRENRDPAHVDRYDAKEDAGAAGEVALLLAAGLPARPTVVDLGAGTGQFTLAVAEHAARVVAVDVSPEMLERLEANVAGAGATNVECRRAGFLTYEHMGAPADLVYSRYALHHLPDFWKAVALTRAATILAPGGLFRLWDIVYDFEPADAPAALEAWFATVPEGSVEQDWTRAELEEHVRDEHSTFTWLLEPMLERAGFRIEDADHLGGVSARYLCRRA